jgi:hypothetical protein
MPLRGPFLSGAVGSTASLEAILRWARGSATDLVVVLGPLWLGVALASELRVVMLVATDDHPAVKRARRRAHKARRAFEVAVGGAEVPLRPRSVGAMIVENTAGLDAVAAARWIEALVPSLRPGGRLIAADATSDVAAMARVSGTFLSASLVGLTQEQPRDGVVLTVAQAPDARVMSARYAPAAAAPATTTQVATPAAAPPPDPRPPPAR